MMNVIDKIAIMNRARAKYRIEHDIKIKEQAEKSFEQYKNDPLFIAGIMLYREIRQYLFLNISVQISRV